MEGKTSTLKLLITELGAELDSPDNGGNTPLHAAAHEGCESTVQLLSDYGANLDVKSHRGETALDYGKVQENHGVVRILEAAETIRGYARSGSISDICNFLKTTDSVPSLIQWCHLLPVKAHAELKSWVSSSIADSRACYLALYGPVHIQETSTGPVYDAHKPIEFQDIVHIGLSHIPKLITTFLVYEKPTTRKALRDLMIASFPTKLSF